MRRNKIYARGKITRVATLLVTLATIFLILSMMPQGTMEMAFASPLPRTTCASRTARHAGHVPPLVLHDRIAALVLLAQPHCGADYARRVACAIRSAAAKTGVDTTVIATTAYVESEFRMSAGPCRGIMQVYLPTLQEMRRRHEVPSRLDPEELRDNIVIGAYELKRYNARAHGSREARLSYIWGRYNGAGTGSRYSRQCLKVLQRIENKPSCDWRTHIARYGALWLH